MKRIFRSGNTIMYRIPYKSEKFKEMDEGFELYLQKLLKDNVFCEQLLIASPNLYNALIRDNFNELSKKKQNNFTQSLLSYVNRAAMRTTPFGLFAGVGITKISDKLNTNRADISEEFSFKKHSRIDIEWLFEVIKKAENENYKYLSFQINNGTYYIGSRAYLAYNTDSKTNKVSINLTKPYLLIEKYLEKYRTATYEQIINMLQQEYPEKDEITLQNFIKTLIEKEFLISTLRPPLVNTDELSWVIKSV